MKMSSLIFQYPIKIYQLLRKTCFVDVFEGEHQYNMYICEYCKLLRFFILFILVPKMAGLCSSTLAYQENTFHVLKITIFLFRFKEMSLIYIVYVYTVKYTRFCFEFLQRDQMTYFILYIVFFFSLFHSECLKLSLRFIGKEVLVLSNKRFHHSHSGIVFYLIYIL